MSAFRTVASHMTARFARPQQDDLLALTHREWDRLLAEASGPSERADIDAMFAAALS